jgi:gluconate 2-dehydrogenase gamma chain
MTVELNRRGFLSGLSASAAAAWFAASHPGLANAAAAHAGHLAAGTLDAALVTLSKAEAVTVDAITARIVPSEGEGPGAREARVVNFIDRALEGVLRDRRTEFFEGLRGFEAAHRETHTDDRTFAALSAANQDAFLKTQEQSEFFGGIRFLTVVGMLALPSYGGNADKAGWRLIGFEDTHAFAPPFGYYDRDYPGFEAVAARQRSGADQ